jgi:predicted dehydrogenase
MPSHNPSPLAATHSPQPQPLQPDSTPAASADSPPVRRQFLQRAAVFATALGAGRLAQAQASGASNGQVQFPPIFKPTEPPESTPSPGDAPDKRVGYALVGLGRLTVGEILPAMGKSKHCKVVALVSGDRAKAMKIAAQHGVPDSGIYGYDDFDRIKDNPAVDVVYIVLPNSMHAEYTVRAAKAGKHVLCEKPMANSVAECQQMIDACNQAGKKLMIAYRSQYEPMNRAIVKMVKEKKLGTLKHLITSNSQNSDDPQHWRFKKALAGGGAMPDVGIYCLNAARFISGEEPTEVTAQIYQPKDDPRFTEVEESVTFQLVFPSGFRATCLTSYGDHQSKFMRFQGSAGYAEMDPAYSYTGLKLRTSMLVDGKETVMEPAIANIDQFAAEMDHMAICVRTDRRPYSPGEEGLQDQRYVEAIYEAARTGRPVKVAPVTVPRGPEPEEWK